MFRQSQILWRYGLAIASVLIALLLMLALDPAIHLTQASFLLFFGAVTLSALYGGRGPGIAATLLSAGCAKYFLLEPQYTWTLDFASSMRMVLFILQGLLISCLVGALRQAQERTRLSFNQLKVTKAEVQHLNQVLQRRVDELQTLFDGIPISIAIAEDPDCRVVKINPTFSKLLQIQKPASPTGSTTLEAGSELFRIYQNGRELTGDELPSQYAAKHGVELRDLEIDIVRQDGTVFNLYGYASPLFDEFGQPRGSVSAFVDMSERKRGEAERLRAEQERERAIAELQQSEERYRYLAESIPQLIWTSTPAGELLDVNQRWLDFTGLTLAQAQAEGWVAVVHPDDIPTLSERWNVAQKEGSHYQAEGRMRRSDGVYCWHLHQAIALKNEQGQIIKWFGTATDIGDKKRLEQQLDRFLQQEQAARAAAEQANRIKDEFLAVLSHELRSPLNPILGWARLLRTGKLDATKTAYALETIERNAKLQTQLIEDLLDVSRILRGKLSLHMAPVDLALVIEAASETVRLAAEAKSIHLKIHTVSIIGQVLGDAARLQQVVWNLLSNAVKFTSLGGQVQVQLEQVTGKRPLGMSLMDDPLPITHYAQITVSDTGQGISADFLPYIFEYFRQADATTTRRFGGLGLGLAIVRQLVELHGGTVEATSDGEGKGATFMVQLPILNDKAKSLPRQVNGSSLPPNLPHPLQGVHILLVDDEPDARDLITFVLETSGAMVTPTTSAREALDLFAKIKPDLVISDIGMPEMDGYALIRQIRALPAEQGGQVPAIALTAYAGEGNQQQAIAAGFQLHLSKPVETEELVEVVSGLLLQPGGDGIGEER